MQTQSIGIPRTTGYVFENDSIRIVYDFWSMQGQMSFELWNKLNVPIFIDWKNSAFIKNGEKFDYYIDRTVTNSKESGYYAYGVATKKGQNVSIRDERVTSVPPKTKITVNKYKIMDLPDIPGNLLNKTYNNITSILTFRNYMAYSLSESLENTTYIDNAFYLTKAFKIPSGKAKQYRNMGDFWLP
jgi:hypothetical protein